MVFLFGALGFAGTLFRAKTVFSLGGCGPKRKYFVSHTAHMKTAHAISTAQATEHTRPELKPQKGYFTVPRTEFQMMQRRAKELWPILEGIISQIETEMPRPEWVHLSFDYFMDLTGESERSVEMKLAELQKRKLVVREFPERRFIRDRGGYQVNMDTDKIQKIPLRSRHWHGHREAVPSETEGPKGSLVPPESALLDQFSEDAVLAKAEEIKAKRAYLRSLEPRQKDAAPTEAPQVQQDTVDVVTGTKFIAVLTDPNFDPREYEVECGLGGWHPLYRIRRNQTLAREPVPETPDERLENIRAELDAVQRDILPRLGPPSPKTVQNFAECDPAKHSYYIGRTCANIVRANKKYIESWGLAVNLYKKHLGNTS